MISLFILLQRPSNVWWFSFLHFCEKDLIFSLLSSLVISKKAVMASSSFVFSLPAQFLLCRSFLCRHCRHFHEYNFPWRLKRQHIFYPVHFATPVSFVPAHLSCSYTMQLVHHAFELSFFHCPGMSAVLFP